MKNIFYSCMLVLFITAAASGQVTFMESAVQLGIDELDFGVGVAILDINGDNVAEIISTSKFGQDRLYRWDGVIYVEMGEQFGLLPTDGHHSITIADVDKTRAPDIYIGGDNSYNHGHFYINDSGMSFTDLGVEYNLFATDDMGAAFLQLPPFASISILRGRRLMTLQDSVFIDITNGSGLEELSNVFVPLFIDIDGDNDDDLFISHNWEFQNASLYRNNGDGTFSNISQNTSEGAFVATCCAISGDYDGDGDIDIYQLSGYDENVLWQNDGTGFFTDVAAETYTDYSGYTRSGSFGDFDNDGDLDLFLNRALDYNMILLNDGMGRYYNYSFQAGVVDSLNGGGCAVGDLNNDGQLDIVTANCNFAQRQVYINQNQNSAFLKIKIIGRPNNTLALGASVKLYGVSSSGLDTLLIGSRQIMSLTAMFSVNEPIVHFGTGSYQYLFAHIDFKSGATLDIGDLTPGQSLAVSEPSITAADDDIPSLPEALSLQAYPNPFNASIKLAFSIDSPERIGLHIYSLTGGLVTMLIDDKPVDRGYYSVYWNAFDKQGDPIPSGIYFVRLQVGEKNITRPITLMK